MADNQNSNDIMARLGRTFLAQFQPNTFNNSYTTRAYIDSGIDPNVVNAAIGLVNAPAQAITQIPPQNDMVKGFKDIVNTGNAIAKSVRKHNAKKSKTPEQLAYEQAINASNGNESSAIIQDYYNKHGINKSIPSTPVSKTALSDAQRDYYNYLTGYQRMSPNQALLSMGLDPTKYTY